MRNIKKNEEKAYSSEVVLQSIWKLFDHTNVVIPDAYIDRAHRVSKTSDTVVVHFITFTHHTKLYCNREALKIEVTV